MVVIVGAYSGLFVNIRVTRLSTPLSSDEMNFALRFFFIVVTNCLCWLPIMCVKVAALAHIDIHQGVYAWLVVLVLPINSAVNPGLYTFSTSQFQSQVSSAVGLFRRTYRRQNSDTEALRHSSTRVSSGNKLTAHNYHHNQPQSPYPLPSLLNPKTPPLNLRHAEDCSSEKPNAMPEDKYIPETPSTSPIDDSSDSKLTYSYRNGYSVPRAPRRAASGEGAQGESRSRTHNEDACAQSQVTFSAKVTLPTHSYSDSQISPGDRGQSSTLNKEGCSSPSYPNSSSIGQTPKKKRTYSDAQSFQDICLEAHVSRRGNIHYPLTFTSTTLASTPSFQGSPLYVDCRATATSDFQDLDVLQLNVKVCYSPEMIRTPSQKKSRKSSCSITKASPEVRLSPDANNMAAESSQVGVTNTVRTSPSHSQTLFTSLEQSGEEDI
nr:uncharacterized protein LOC128698323 [Cherax quadricarinatus]